MNSASSKIFPSSHDPRFGNIICLVSLNSSSIAPSPMLPELGPHSRFSCWGLSRLTRSLERPSKIISERSPFKTFKLTGMPASSTFLINYETDNLFSNTDISLQRDILDNMESSLAKTIMFAGNDIRKNLDDDRGGKHPTISSRQLFQMDSLRQICPIVNSVQPTSTMRV